MTQNMMSWPRPHQATAGSKMALSLHASFCTLNLPTIQPKCFVLRWKGTFWRKEVEVLLSHLDVNKFIDGEHPTKTFILIRAAPTQIFHVSHPFACANASMVFFLVSSRASKDHTFIREKIAV